MSSGKLATAKAVAKRFSLHNGMVSSAGVAFYALLALVPTLIAVVSVYGLLTCDPQQVEEQVAQIGSGLGDDAKSVLTSILEDTAGTQEGGCGLGVFNDGIGQATRQLTGLVIGVVLALWSASGAVQKLLITIGIAYQAIDERPAWKRRLVSYGFTMLLVAGFVLLTAVLTGVPAALDRLELSGLARFGVTVGQFPLIAVLFGVAMSFLYRYGPYRSTRTPWRNPGAVVATALFVLFAIGLSLYASVIGGMPASYGVLGGLAAVMLFLQLSTLAIVVGAETNGEVERRDGRSSEQDPATTPDSSDPASAPEPLGFGKAVAGLAVLALFGRENR